MWSSKHILVGLDYFIFASLKAKCLCKLFFRKPQPLRTFEIEERGLSNTPITRLSMKLLMQIWVSGAKIIYFLSPLAKKETLLSKKLLFSTLILVEHVEHVRFSRMSTCTKRPEYSAWSSHLCPAGRPTAPSTSRDFLLGPFFMFVKKGVLQHCFPLQLETRWDI